MISAQCAGEAASSSPLGLVGVLGAGENLLLQECVDSFEFRLALRQLLFEAHALFVAGPVCSLDFGDSRLMRLSGHFECLGQLRLSRLACGPLLRPFLLRQGLALVLRLDAGLLAQCPGACVNGARDARLPNTLNVRFPGVEGDTLLLSLPDIALSTGSACSSHSHLRNNGRISTAAQYK